MTFLFNPSHKQSFRYKRDSSFIVCYDAVAVSAEGLVGKPTCQLSSVVPSNDHIADCANIIDSAFVNGSCSPMVFGVHSAVNDSYFPIHTTVEYRML